MRGDSFGGERGVVVQQRASAERRRNDSACRGCDSAPQKILHINETIPVKAGALTLYYPEWIPGEHAPDGPIMDVAGLKFSAGGKEIPWRRDLVDMFAFHLEVPAGAESLDVQLDFLLSAAASGFSAGASATGQLDLLSWNQVLLYPKGSPVSDIFFEPSLRLPEGWKYGTALPVAGERETKFIFSACRSRCWWMRR